ncbi:MAG: D-alanyl-D-alanine carboxypeptidase [Dorea sp.]|nr:D-alanyl-D-alanine carboxypeptidase [Dorea sp.]MDY2812943.1 serine hydrolase [Dorea sp.]
MKCIGRYFKWIFAFSAAVIILFIVCFSRDENVVTEYETKNYNKNLYTEKLFATDLCVASGNVDLEGITASDTESLHSAALFDLDSKQVDFSYQMFDKVYPASTTKLMTALVALKYGDLDGEVTVSENADKDSFAYDEQTCGLESGDQLTLSDLLNGLLLYSGNDNAVAIAEYIGGTMDKFADMMNEEAKKLMATGTHFVNSSGLHDENHYTTAYDLYLIFQECLKYDEFVEIISSDSYTADITGADGTVRQVTWEPTNYYATGEAQSPDNVTIIGGKTGTTDPAGNCLVLLEKDKNDHPYISIVMGADTKALLYQDMTTLIKAIPEKNE